MYACRWSAELSRVCGVELSCDLKSKPGFEARDWKHGAGKQSATGSIQCGVQLQRQLFAEIQALRDTLGMVIFANKLDLLLHLMFFFFFLGFDLLIYRFFLFKLMDMSLWSSWDSCFQMLLSIWILTNRNANKLLLVYLNFQFRAWTQFLLLWNFRVVWELLEMMIESGVTILL